MGCASNSQSQLEVIIGLFADVQCLGAGKQTEAIKGLLPVWRVGLALQPGFSYYQDEFQNQSSGQDSF